MSSEDLSSLVTAQTEVIQTAEPKDTIGPLNMKNGKKGVLVFLNADPVLSDEDKVEYIIFTVYDLTEKIDELNKQEEDKSEVEELHEAETPRIKELPEDGDHRFTAEKIGFKSE